MTRSGAVLDIVRTDALPWQNGLDVVGAMTPAFRENLGPSHLLEQTYAKYNQKTLTKDTATTYRGDLVYLEAGYADLTNAYHDSVEECFFLSGDCTLTGEQLFTGGDYFWRPPGFIHAASTVGGFVGLLFLEGESEREASGPASRVIRPVELAGTQGLRDDPDTAVGPRGWVRVRSRDLPWLQGRVYERLQGSDLSELDLARLSVRLLSSNPTSGGHSALFRLDPGYRQPLMIRHTERMGCFVVSGSIDIGAQHLSANSWVQFAPGEAHEAFASLTGALLFVKVAGFLDVASPKK
jgi:hypothetical protein